MTLLRIFLLLFCCVGIFAAEKGTEGILPVPSQDSVRLIKVKSGLEVELVASEPQVVDPVAIDWGADGKLWVCEMNDYPAGMDGNYEPGGRVKFLEDADGDGKYEKATVFMEGLPFPTGVTAWGRGVFICAAPDLIYAEDTNGDGKADKIEKIFTGFATENYQARLNSLSLGLDNWIYGANGLLGGIIHGQSMAGDVNIRNRDFRFHPATKTFEAVSGLTQYGRVRDDWGDWFGCNNSQLLFHFPFVERYLARNPAVTFPSAIEDISSGNRIYPISKLQERYNDPDNANRVTSGGGLGIYRDALLGAEYYGNAFTCEPVHNLVHREVVKPAGPKFTSGRAPDEQESEFLASSDNWFRPVQVRTGPDGALYVVDMYRFLIEHPRWIAAKRLSQINVRAGSDMGRIYRVKPAGKKLRPIRNVTALDPKKLAEAIGSPNGTERDRVQIELLHRRDAASAPQLELMANIATLPQVRLQALSALEGIGQLREETILKALKDGDATVRKHGIQVAEPFLRASASPALITALIGLTNDISTVVLGQLALTMGEWDDPRAGAILAGLAKKHPGDVNLRWSILASASRHSRELLVAVGKTNDWMAPLTATAAASGDGATIQAAVDAILPAPGARITLETFSAIAALKGKADLGDRAKPVMEKVRLVATDRRSPENLRVAAVKLLDDSETLTDLALRDPFQAVKKAALNELRKQTNAEVAAVFLKEWRQIHPLFRPDFVALLIERPQWSAQLLKAIDTGVVQLSEISATDRQRLGIKSQTGRETALAKYSAIKSMEGKPAPGAEIFNKNCAVCHALKGMGQAVGPDLAALADKDADYFVKNIIDPNAIVEPRFVAYNIELKDDRSILGVIKSENAGSLTVVTGGGQTETISRNDINEIRASSLSLMPEGLEEAIPPADMANLVAFLQAKAAAPQTSSEEVLRNPAAVARFILDEKQPGDLREQAVKANPQFAADLITELTRDLAPGTPEEYRRIPWIWRVAIASARRNTAEQIRRILETSLPREGEVLHDWQAVVIGGGVINGLSQRDLWPRERIHEIIANDAALQKRWRQSLDLAATMTDNEKVPAGTRYDALRMLGMEDWSKTGAQITRYLAHANGELQMGAVSGLVDVNSPEAARALINSLPKLTPQNRDLALDGLLRDSSRAQLLLDEIAAQRLTISSLGEKRIQRLQNFPDEKIRARAASLAK